MRSLSESLFESESESLSEPLLISTVAEIRAERTRRKPNRLALVPTMGALHGGHLSLVQQARALADLVVVSIFVNPLQFGKNEDLDRYSQTLVADLALLVGHADIVFAPNLTEMYPGDSPNIWVSAGSAAELFEGAIRPEHFNGMLTVVNKLFQIVQPEVAVFGQKDAQQLHLITEMVRDFNIPVELVVAPTVREPDGLAMSSRNRYLNSEERVAAVTIFQALKTSVSLAPTTTLAAAVAAGILVLNQNLAITVDYFAAVNPNTFLPVTDEPSFTGAALLIVAARVGSTRLIDNMLLPARTN